MSRGLILLCALAAKACDVDAPVASDLAPSLPELVLERTLTSPYSLELSRVLELDVDSRGRVFVVDGFGGGVTVLSPTLELLRVVGRAGEGPGEFGMRDIQILNGDSLAVYDSQLGRATIFDPDSLAVARIRAASEYGSDAPSYYWLVGASRSLAASTIAYWAGGESDSGAEDRDVVMTAMLNDPIADTVLSVPSSQPVVFRGGDMMLMASNPFGAAPLIQPLDQSSFVYANTGEARFWIIGLSGDTIAVGEIPEASIPVTESQLDSAARRMGNELGGVLRDGAPYQWPIIVALVREDAEDARIWISARGAVGAADWPVHIYDLRGQREAVSSLPAGEVLHSVRGGVAVTTSLNELRIPRIHRYRIARAPE